jgi:hypothetical protein
VFHVLIAALAAVAGIARPAAGAEIWVAPTYQQDLGGLGVATNAIWPVTPVGVVRLAWAIPADLETFQSAKIVVIPNAPGGAATLNLFVCQAENADIVGTCTGPLPHAFTGVANQLTEIDISASIGPRVGSAGLNYLAVLAYTTPTTGSDRILGLRFGYTPALPNGAATLGANTFTGTQTAPAFAGSGAALTGVAKLGANTFTGTQTAPSFEGSGANLTGVAKLTANTFTGTQTISAGGLNLSMNTGITHTGNGDVFAHTRGAFNTFVGLRAGESAGAGTGNTAVGNSALKNNVDGRDNTAVGDSALLATTGFSNTAVGQFALLNNTTGFGNTAVGQGAIALNVSGTANTAFGAGTLDSLTSGSFNIAIGGGAGSNLTSGSSNIYIQNTGSATDSNTIRIGDVQTRAFMRGIRGVTTGSANAIAVLIDSQGQLGTVSSSRTVKEEIQDMADRSRRVLQLRPVTFRYTRPYEDGGKPLQYGLIAEEVAEVFPEIVVHDADGQPETVQYHTLNVLLLNELQRQERELRDARERLRALEDELAALVGRLLALEGSGPAQSR